MPTELWYFADPMCSWCWGFSPIVHRLEARVGDDVPLVVLVGGLAVGASEPMSEALKHELWHHWEEVRASSGQAFDFGFFEREDFLYDSEPACRAVVAARRSRPSCALDMLTRLQRAFYAENQDITDDRLNARLAAGLGPTCAFEADHFLALLEAKETVTATRDDFELARRLGIRGFPTLLGRHGDELVPLCVGYRDEESLFALVDAWLADVAEQRTASRD